MMGTSSRITASLIWIVFPYKHDFSNNLTALWKNRVICMQLLFLWYGAFQLFGPGLGFLRQSKQLIPIVKDPRCGRSDTDFNLCHPKSLHSQGLGREMLMYRFVVENTVTTLFLAEWLHRERTRAYWDVAAHSEIIEIIASGAKAKKARPTACCWFSLGTPRKSEKYRPLARDTVEIGNVFPCSIGNFLKIPLYQWIAAN